ncbi:TAFII55-N domain-containing protein [Aphelenchoides bicaudatus]|nr:TAFII55-N domain-containing protein [Aphelenchoides bicaudatus]
MTSSSTSKIRRKKDTPLNDEFEWENHWLLRVPENYSERIRQFCETQTSKDRLKVKFNQDQRHGTLQVGPNTLHFTVYDLPCIIEVLKTIDKVNMFKVNNLSQMLLCTEEPPQMPTVQSPLSNQQPTTSADGKTAEETEADAQLAKQKREKMYQYPHGILPPLKNVRKRRFRKTKKKKYMDKPEVDKEVKRLFRDDLGATRTWYEIVTVDEGATNQKEKAPKEKSKEKQANDLFEEAQRDLFAQQELDGNDTIQSIDADQSAPQQDLLDVFGEISSSEDEDD